MNKGKSLYEFGYNFLGPICSEYFHTLEQHSDDIQPSNVLFLAREGFFFRKAYRTLIEQNLLENKKNTYLLASRTFLFRICIADEFTWQWSLSHKFDGSLQKLLLGRFGFNLRQIQAVFNAKELSEEWTLPSQKEELEDVLKRHIKALGNLVQDSRLAYLDYLHSLGLDKHSRPLMVDLGYSGTIQKILTHLLKANTNGIYFIATTQGDHRIGDHTAHMRCVYKHGVKMGDGYNMLDRSLFLESLLTSPNGQFIDIRRKQDMGKQSFEFFFGRTAYTQRNFHELNLLFDGAIEAISHAFTHKVRYQIDEIEMLYDQYTRTRNLMPTATRALFELDDAISGNLNVNPLHLFGV